MRILVEKDERRPQLHAGLSMQRSGDRRGPERPGSGRRRPPMTPARPWRQPSSPRRTDAMSAAPAEADVANRGPARDDRQHPPGGRVRLLAQRPQLRPGRPVIVQALRRGSFQGSWITGGGGRRPDRGSLSSIYLVSWLAAGCSCSARLPRRRVPGQASAAEVVRCGNSTQLCGLLFDPRPHHPSAVSAGAYAVRLLHLPAAGLWRSGDRRGRSAALLAFNPSWRLLFAVLGARAVCLVLVGLFIFPDDRPRHRPEHAFDFAGAGLFVAIFGLCPVSAVPRATTWGGASVRRS